MKIFEQFAESHNITFNPTKTKLLCFNMKPESTDSPKGTLFNDDY